jgi:hypothetical protein
MSIFLCFRALSAMRLATKICEFISAQILRFSSIPNLRRTGSVRHCRSATLQLSTDERLTAYKQGKADPEHGPEEDGVSFDQQLVWDLFTNYIEASKILDMDVGFRRRVAAMKSKLLEPRIGKWGQLDNNLISFPAKAGQEYAIISE